MVGDLCVYTTATTVSKQTNHGEDNCHFKKINKREVEGEFLHKAE
jgi:hypothetical protein